MLLRPMHDQPYTATDPLYNPLGNFSQSELMEKFNLAFYEAQTVTKSDIAETFQEEPTNGNDNDDDYLIDYLISEDSTTPRDCDINNFDFNDFVEDFDQNVRDSFSDSTTVTEFDTETFTTESAATVDDGNFSSDFSSFFVPPPLFSEPKKSDEFTDALSCESFSEWTVEIQDLDAPNLLPPVGSIIRNNFDFNCYVRNIPEDDMGYLAQDTEGKNEFGHLSMQQDFTLQPFESLDNQMVLRQSDALLNDDPLLSSSNNFYVQDEVDDDQLDEVTPDYQCKWENCYQKCVGQTGLVNHIEKCHVEIKRGDEFTCYWEQCPRKTKPFNARYKLLIHMRVHSGEKPNKCPFKGCSKAFSRLENLKIHQRSHTGERPYLCQFNGCSKCFSNSSDRAKHQRTHFDTKPYGCQVVGCQKKYTDPSSLRKHVKNHTVEEQQQIKQKSPEESVISNAMVKKYLDPSRQKAIKTERSHSSKMDHSYSNAVRYVSLNVKQDLKNKIEKNRFRKISC